MKHIEMTAEFLPTVAQEARDPKRIERSWETQELNILKGDIWISRERLVYLINGAGIIVWPGGRMPGLSPNLYLTQK